MQANTAFQIGQTVRLHIDFLPSEGLSAGTKVRIVGIENHQPRVEEECPQQAEEQNEIPRFLRTFYVVEIRSTGTGLGLIDDGEEAFYEFQYGIERPKVNKRTLGCLVHGRDLTLDN